MSVGAIDLLLIATTIIVPLGPGIVSGSTLAFGTADVRVVLAGRTNGAAKSAWESSPFMNVTVWGSPTEVGLIQFTVSPTLISATRGKNQVVGAICPPPPARTVNTPS